MTKEEKKRYNQQYYLKNKERLNARSKQYHEANKDKIRKYREANKDKINARTRAFYASEGGKKIKEYNKKYREENREKFRASSSKWQKANPNKKNAATVRRRTALMNRKPEWADDLVINMIYEDCPKGYEVDHIIPLQGENVSGLHVAWNLQYLTPIQNQLKGNKYELR